MTGDYARSAKIVGGVEGAGLAPDGVRVFSYHQSLYLRVGFDNVESGKGALIGVVHLECEFGDEVAVHLPAEPWLRLGRHERKARFEDHVRVLRFERGGVKLV